MSVPDMAVAEDVIRLRLSQMLVNECNRRGDFKVPIHLALGHEAVAVALARAKSDEDKILLTHRNIHYNFAIRPALRPKIDEFRLADTGSAGGELGCMNFCDEDAGIVYTSSILGNNMCVAPGVALAARVRNQESLTIVVTGDGAIEEGAFHEGVLMMKSLGLPALVIVENNGWSLATRIAERRTDIQLAQWAAAFAVPYRKLEGNDVYAYADTFKTVRAEALAQETPVIVEVSVETLGDWVMQADAFPDGKPINYHAGLAPTVALSNGPIIEDGTSDPAFVLAAQFGADKIAAMATRLLSLLEAELQ